VVQFAVLSNIDEDIEVNGDHGDLYTPNSIDYYLITILFLPIDDLLALLICYEAVV